MILDRSGTCVCLNAACRDLLGVDSDQQVISKYNIFDDIEIRRLRLRRAVRKVMEAGAVLDKVVGYDFSRTNLPVPHSLGRRILRLLIFPLWHGSGQPDYAVMQIEDCTEKESAGRKLCESEARYRAVVQDQTELICRFLPDTTLTFVNDAYCRYFGRSRESLIGHSFLPLIPTEDQARVREHLASLNCENPVATQEHRVVGPGRRICWQQWTNRVICNERKEVVEFQAVGRDITERKEAEEKYRDIFENSVLGIFQVAPDGVFLTVNAAGARTLGYDSPEELISSCASIMEAYVHPERRAEHVAAIRASAGITRREEEFRRKDGQIITVAVYARAVRDEDGNVRYVEGFVEDITERKQEEQRRAEMEEHKREFYRRTLLAATGGKLEVVERDDILAQVGRPVSSFKIRRPEDLSKIRRAASDLADDAGMDEERLFGFVLCLGEAMTNALKHAGRGTVSFHRSGDGLVFVVSDKGPGIEALTLPEATLMRGYSTIGSLGMGYKAMLSVADKVYLCTGPSGTTVAVEMGTEETRPTALVEALPETW